MDQLAVRTRRLAAVSIVAATVIAGLLSSCGDRRDRRELRQR